MGARPEGPLGADQRHRVPHADRPGLAAPPGPEIGGRRTDDLLHDVEAEGLPDHQDPQPPHARGRVRGASDARLCQEDAGKVAGARAAGNAGTGEL